MIAQKLDYVITKTRKKGSAKTFSTRSIMVVMEQMGYKGGTSNFLRFLKEYYAGESLFPDLSAFSVDNKKMYRLEANKDSAEGKEKWEKCQEEARGVVSRMQNLLHNTYPIGMVNCQQKRAFVS